MHTTNTDIDARTFAMWVRRICAVIIMVGALWHMPYGYYTLVRLATTLVCAGLAVRCYSASRMAWAATVAAIALLYNPVVPIYMARTTWTTIDAVTALTLMLLIPDC